MCSFLGGKKLRLNKKLSVPAVSKSAGSVRAVAADPERPIWFPGSTPPEWLDGSLLVTSDSILLVFVSLFFSNAFK